MDPDNKEVRALMGLDEKIDLATDAAKKATTKDASAVSQDTSQQESFQKMFKDNEKVKQSYKDLYQYNNKHYDNASFSSYVMRGYLRKRVAECKIFQRSKHPKRFFVVDFRTGTISVYHTEDEYKQSNLNRKDILFRDIKQLTLFSKEAEKKYEVASKNYRFPFIVNTNERKFELFASSEEERQMWVVGFQYILISTSEVQNMMNK